MKSKRFICLVCNYSCGRSKQFELHMINEHNYESLKEAYVDINNTSKYCQCQCGKETKFNGWNKGFAKFLKGHNGSIYSSYSKEEAESISQKRINKLKGRKGWSAGLTKENNESLAKAAETRSKTVKKQFDSGERMAWSKGLTKETDYRLFNVSNNLKESFSSGERIAWSKGLTKETDSRVMNMSINVSKSLSKKNIRNKLDSQKRLSKIEIIRRLDQCVDNLVLLSDLDFYTRDIHKNLEFKCTRCDLIQTKSLLQALSNRCDECDKNGSKGQIEINDFILSLGLETLFCDRSIIHPYEVDIFIPSLDFGIEFNGLYYHSELFKDRNYHSKKSDLFCSKNLTLFHVFEDEWSFKKDIIKSMIKHRCGKSENRVYARQCEIREVSPKDRKEFFNRTHIDGDVKSKIAFGLYNNNNLISCLSLRSPFHKKYNNSIELARFSSELNTSVIGGLSKLQKHIVKWSEKNEYSSIISYVDLRHGNGGGYFNAGYQEISRTPSRFWWVDGKNRINRFQIRADSKNNKTEKQVADEMGVVKIWGCKNLVMEYRLKVIDKDKKDKDAAWASMYN